MFADEMRSGPTIDQLRTGARAEEAELERQRQTRQRRR
jgi:hypothetical protein